MFIFKMQVIADSSGSFAGNAMLYETQVEAESAARDLMSRWMMVATWRVLRATVDVGAVLLETVSSEIPDSEWSVVSDREGTEYPS